ncbi:MAG: AmmeMemoRadiSam system protein B [Candidatus Niyogibacteria bacterium RIFCSPLOWO2_02_FULL_45_13]|uniref:AmmeMemoRadiSam system protein B n=1 Tax=Candidatus Niyogibacteria bacterium RIFCSPLOWO2_02_FULL_45_13 TaxID=1801725 RepID=A0A1G2F084_9BACT|nr:MAG: AmmeMemoRadiSam system protein B [Candidatus Niyogibacteria bacterium RIFCSPLOWO2_02_FULL_45_13]
MIRRIPKIYIAAVLLVSVGVGLYFILPYRKGPPEIAQAYHQSQFFKYSEFIESSVRDADSDAKIDLNKIMGGIVPHHIPTTIPLLAEFYTKLKNARDVKTFVILAPDHVDAGRGNISISKADFIMPFGALRPNLAMIEQLESSGFLVQDEAPFDREHSIDSQLLLISKLFPDAQIVPLIFRSSITNEEARAFGKILAGVVDESTFIVSSVDFSHYLSERQARPIDYLSANVLGAIDSKSTDLVKADSEQSLVALMSFLETKGANHHVDLQVFNTRDFNSNNDYTTGYVTGFWGIKYGVSGQVNNNEPITLLFVGDIMLSRLIGDIMAKKNDWRYPFLETADFLKGADVTFGNLEGPISSRGTKVGSIYSFRSDPRAIEGLLYAGFDVLSIANNHIWDYGADAVRDTLAILKDAGIGVTGGGVDYQEAHRPLIKEVRGTRVGFLGYTDLISSSLGSKTAKPAIAFLDIDLAISDVKEARKEADLVVVSLHWGNEYETTQSPNQEKVAKSLIDAGAQLIIGHHPHVVQPVMEYGGGFIAYSLGNFIFDQNFSLETKTGLILKVTLKDKRVSQIEEMKIAFTSSYQPYLSDSN